MRTDEISFRFFSQSEYRVKMRKYNLFFIVLSYFFSIHDFAQNERCINDLSDVDAYNSHQVSTNYGDIIGKRETGIDQRQNKSVTWTSFYVSSQRAPEWCETVSTTYKWVEIIRFLWPYSTWGGGAQS